MIGSALVWRLNQKGFDEILVVDHMTESEKWKKRGYPLDSALRNI
jgi:hypothetical protein